MDFESVRGAFARRGTGAASLRAVMGRRAHYARPLPPLTSPTKATLRTVRGSAVILDREGRDNILAMFDGAVPAIYLRTNGKGHYYPALNLPPGPGRPRGNTVTLARLILGEEAVGARVQYRDGNRLNLCRDNLKVVRSEGEPKVTFGAEARHTPPEVTEAEVVES